jgi:hypothetical protein
LTTRGDGGIVEFSSTVARPQPLHIDRCGAHESAASGHDSFSLDSLLGNDGVSRDDRRRAEPDSRGSMSASRPASALDGHRRADSKSTRRSAQSRHNTNRHESPFCGSSMDFVDRGDDRPEPISIARCRELLGDEADTLTDQDIEMFCRHAETMAQIVVEMFVESRRTPG